MLLIGLNAVLLFHIQVLLMSQDTVLHNQVLVGLSAVLLVQVLMCVNAVTNSCVVDECRWWVSVPCYICRCRWWG